VQSYQVPFHVNMLDNSDRLFPDMEPTGEDKKPFQQPVKGWVPRGWDDGAGYDKNTWKPFEDSYFTSSNHLMQDVADALLNVWMATQDPRVAQAIMHIHNYKGEYFGAIPVIDFAAGMANSASELYESHRLPVFSTSAMNPYYTGMYEQKAHFLSSYDDNLAWEYRAATAKYMLQGVFSEEFALYALAKVYSHMMGMEMFFDYVMAYPYGMYFFDIQRQPSFMEGEGKLDGYASDTEKLLGARGIQISWVGAAVLPILVNQPDLWERPYRDNHSDETLIRIVDAPPVTDGRRDKVYSKSQSIDRSSAHISFVSDPRNLHMFIESEKPKVAIQIQHTGPVVGETHIGNIVVTHRGEISVANDIGEKIMHVANSTPGERWTAELRIPYTIIPGQAHWINGVEHGRYTVTINDDKQHIVYLLSEPERIICGLEKMGLAGVGLHPKRL
jgi:hypothetical protein